MQLTAGLRGSRTWQAWLHSTHGRTVPGAPARTLLTSSGSAIWARVISTTSAAPDASASCAMATSTIDPCATTATCSGSASRTRRLRSRLKPGGVCPSGRVAETL